MKLSFLVPTLGTRIKEINRLIGSIANFKCEYEIVIIAQDNFDEMLKLKEIYNININVICINERGLSHARNIGLKECTGDIIVLSDDDCWYPENADELILSSFSKNIDVLMTEIYDPINDCLYKNYPLKVQNKFSKFSFHSKSSIEIAFSSKYKDIEFDELFGLGGKYVCCEEIDYLIRLKKLKAKMLYIPKVSVYHERKNGSSSKQQIIAKGANYSKNFSLLTSFAICLRDLILKRENNFKLFYLGYKEYKSMKKRR